MTPSPVKPLRRALRLVLAPEEEWREIGVEPRDGWSVLSSFLLPMACIPTAAWCVNLLLFGEEGRQSDGRAVIGLAQVLSGGLTVWSFTVASVLALAISLYILAPLFAPRRDWPGALTVAAFSSAPAILGGVILAIPGVSYVILLALFHSCYLLYAGLQRILGVREENAAEYVALGIVLCTVATTALGALGGALGVL